MSYASASPFVETDLFSHIPRDEWEPLSTELVQSGDPVPFDSLNVEAWRELQIYTAKYAVPEDILKRHWRVLVFRFGYKRLAKLPKKWEVEIEETMKFLREVRDGKFTEFIPPEDPAPDDIPEAGAEYGGEERFDPRF